MGLQTTKMTFVAKIIDKQHQYSFQLYNLSQEINSTSRTEEHTHKEESSTNTEFIFIVIYCLTFLLGIFPNLIISYILFTRKYMRLKYIFTASISIAHVTFCCVCIPIIIYEIIYVHSTVGTILCQVVVCLTFSATSLSMLSTAVRRALALSEGFRHATFTYRGKVKNIFVIWLFSLLTALPYICTEQGDSSPFDLTEQNELNKHYHNTQSDGSDHVNDSIDFSALCHPVSNKTQPTNCTLGDEQVDTKISTGNCIIDIYLYTTCLTGILLFLSVLVSLVLQTITMKAIKKRPNQIHWLKEIRITKQHIVMLILFTICWAPLCIVCFLTRKSRLSAWLLTVSNMLAASSVIYNPFLYYILNAHIRRELKLWTRNLMNMFAVVH